MSPETLQGWVAVVGGLLAAIVGLFRYFNYRSKRDRLAEIGASFALTVDALASDNGTSRMAGAVLLRRFFDRHTEQGGRGRPYVAEAIEVMAGMLREEQPPRVQKVLADGLRYARELQDADLQHCDLTNAYVGRKTGDQWPVDLSRADLFGAHCDRASFKAVVARETVFVDAELRKTVFTGADCRNADFRRANLDDAKFAEDQKLPGADCRNADFRGATLSGARFEGAQIGGAKFEGVNGIPEQVGALLDQRMEGLPGAVVPREPPPR
ncbi:MAG TPA: pentapeptide repeat-containing protein [Kribbellaceae bacterium]|nr:pentapeptide repeat-containing protein [Kribbellaceae bacterium]